METLNFTLTDVSFSGAPMNVAVGCSSCRTVYDATGGGDGTFYTGPDGRLRLREAIFEATTAVLSRPHVITAEVEELIGALRTADSGEAVADAVATVGMFPKLEEWVRQNPTMAKVVGALLAAVLTILVARVNEELKPEPKPAPAPVVNVVVDPPSEDELQRLIDQALDEREAAERGEQP
ncbi:hypothetical protein ACI8AG_09155 [Blastococcus sp. SYSU DS0552]